jgi:hypothetical protein
MNDLAEVDPELRAEAALDEVVHQRRQWERANKRPPALTLREALAALEFEAQVVWTAAANVRWGLALTDEDFDRLSLACRRFAAISTEVIR